MIIVRFSNIFIRMLWEQPKYGPTQYVGDSDIVAFCDMFVIGT